mmetsp:Transcript_698/g.1405  ORF Transcript_698/g.1405 Transcript_698/m.1405 type:complete len:280 (+) Transcript_698:2320-3159(+)
MNTLLNNLPPGTDIYQLCQDLAESGVEFGKQFDREDPNFHNGLTTAVPTGGARVPESMAALTKHGDGVHGLPTATPDGKVADWRDLPEAPIAIEQDYGDEHAALMVCYDKLNQAKKAISTLNKPVEAAMKVRLQYKGAEGDDRTALESRLKGEENTRNGALSAASCIVLSMDKELISERTIKMVEAVVDEGKYEFLDKDGLGDYMLVLQKANQAIFADQKKLLARIKAIKKAAREGDAASQPAEASKPAEKAAAGPEAPSEEAPPAPAAEVESEAKAEV